MKKLILHIGMPKTGSTSIQKTFARYSDGTVAYAVLMSPNHSLALNTVFLPKPSDGYFKTRGLDANAFDARRQRFLDVITRELARPEPTLVISSEDLCKFGESEIKALKDLVAKYERDIHVVGYVREPLGLASSRFQTHLRGGKSKAETTNSSPYRTWLESWIKNVSPEHLTFVEFNKTTLIEGDVVKDFAARAGIDPSKITPKRANESINDGAARLLWDFNEKTPESRKSPEAVLARRKIVALLREHIPGGKFELPLANFDAKDLSEDVIWLAEATGIDFQPGLMDKREQMTATPYAEVDNAPSEAARNACFALLKAQGINVSPGETTTQGLQKLFRALVAQEKQPAKSRFSRWIGRLRS